MSLPNKIVTVVIPIFNHERWLDRAVNSILNQTYPFCRLVLVDDASQDSSWKVVTSLFNLSEAVDNPTTDEPRNILIGNIGKMEAIAVRFGKNRGPSSARNYGIKTGWENTYAFSFLDSDDWYEPTKIEESVAILERDIAVGIVYSDYWTVDYEGRKYLQYKEPFSFERLQQECIINCDSVIRKEVFNGLAFPEKLRVCEDYYVWARACKKFLAVHIPKPLLNIQIGPHSSTSTITKEVWEECYREVWKN